MAIATSAVLVSNENGDEGAGFDRLSGVSLGLSAFQCALDWQEFLLTESASVAGTALPLYRSYTVVRH